MTYPSVSYTFSKHFPESACNHFVEQKINQPLGKFELIVKTRDDSTGDVDNEQIINNLGALTSQNKNIIFLV